jgi:hypothetical protein
MRHQPQWSIAIISSRETANVLAAVIGAAARAASDSVSLIDVMVNGNEDLASQTSHWLKNRGDAAWPHIRVWHSSTGDKANAWNQYVHTVWPGSTMAFFVDGYAGVKLDAFRVLSDGLGRDPNALAAAAVPTEGRSAKRLRTMMVREGGIHGNLYAVRGETLALLRERGFRLPLGIYRTDPTLGAAIAFGLDPATYQWDPRRILVQADATWRILTEGPNRLPSVQGMWGRIMRQAQGVLENAAVRDYFANRKCRPESLPRTNYELVQSWMIANPDDSSRTFRRNWLSYYAWRKLRKPRDWSHAEDAPRLLASVGDRDTSGVFARRAPTQVPIPED